MKFLTLCVVAAVALNVVAANYGENVEHGTHYYTTTAHYNRTLKEHETYDVTEYFGRFYEFFKNIFYQWYRQFAQFFPTEVQTAVENVFKYWPSYNQFFTPEFFTAVKEFFRALKDFFMPHQFYAFVDNALNAFPTITELLPPGFLPAVGRYLDYVPFARQFFQQWYYVMEQLVAHNH
uniref:Milk gland protein 2 n=1 Tax=Glossina austeni TaxID=7395 RepID=A0A2C9MDE5_GLOAU